MRLVVRLGLSLAALVAFLFGVGLLLPRDHVATSSIDLSQPPDSVWAVIRDPEALLGHWPELASVRREVTPDGQEAWNETVDGFAMRLLLTEEQPPHRLVMTVDSKEGDAFGGKWVYRIEPTATGSRLIVSEDGWIANPFFRLMGNVMGLHGSIDGYLRAVGTRFGEDPTPVHVDDA